MGFFNSIKKAFQSTGRAIAHPIKTMRGDYREPKTSISDEWAGRQKEHARQYEQSESKKIVDERLKKGYKKNEAKQQQYQENRESYAEAWNDSPSKAMVDEKLGTPQNGGAPQRVGGMIDPSAIPEESEEDRQAIEQSIYTGGAVEGDEVYQAVDIVWPQLPWTGKNANSAYRDECYEQLIGTFNKMKTPIIPSGQFDPETGEEIEWNGSQAIINGMDYNEVWDKYRHLFNTQSELLPYHESVN